MTLAARIRAYRRQHPTATFGEISRALHADPRHTWRVLKRWLDSGCPPEPVRKRSLRRDPERTSELIAAIDSLRARRARGEFWVHR